MRGPDAGRGDGPAWGLLTAGMLGLGWGQHGWLLGARSFSHRCRGHKEIHSLFQHRACFPYVTRGTPGSVQNDTLAPGQSLLLVLGTPLLHIFMGYDSTVPLNNRNRFRETGIYFSGNSSKIYTAHTILPELSGPYNHK